MINRIYIVAIVASMLFGYALSRPVSFRYLPDNAANGWTPGENVTFQYKWNHEAKPAGEMKITMDAPYRTKRSLLNPVVTGPDEEKWFTVNAKIPTMTKPSSLWVIKFETTVVGRDLAVSQPFFVVAARPDQIVSTSSETESTPSQDLTAESTPFSEETATAPADYAPVETDPALIDEYDSSATSTETTTSPPPQGGEIDYGVTATSTHDLTVIPQTNDYIVPSDLPPIDYGVNPQPATVVQFVTTTEPSSYTSETGAVPVPPPAVDYGTPYKPQPAEIPPANHDIYNSPPSAPAPVPVPVPDHIPAPAPPTPADSYVSPANPQVASDPPVDPASYDKHVEDPAPVSPESSSPSPPPAAPAEVIPPKPAKMCRPRQPSNQLTPPPAPATVDNQTPPEVVPVTPDTPEPGSPESSTDLVTPPTPAPSPAPAIVEPLKPPKMCRPRNTTSSAPPTLTETTVPAQPATEKPPKMCRPRK